METTRRVLVVDDEESMRTTLAANLELEGYEVVEARDGAQAIEHVRRQSFALVISDVRMPGLNGIETFREIRRIQPETTVVLMTAFALEKLVEDGIREGVYTVIYKPFSMEHLIRVVARAVDAHAILVVDDLPDLADAIVAALHSVGLRAEAAHDGRTAVQRAREQEVDVCVLDLMMPEQDGVKTWEELQRLEKRITVIAMTGDAAPDMIKTVMTKGGYACLLKPFDMHELMHAIALARGNPAAC